MCGRFVQKDLRELTERFSATLRADMPPRLLPPRFSIAPTAEIGVIGLDGAGQWSLTSMHWGLRRWRASNGWRPDLTTRLLVLLLTVLLALPVSAQTGGGDKAPVKGIGTAVEGDLVTVNGQEFRLFGIDAPDRGQTCVNVRGQQYDCFALSTRILTLLINNMNIECMPRGQSPATGPKLAICRAENGDDLAYAMVERGMALAYRPLSFDYASIEARAVSFRRGLWGGRVEPPWLWRSRQTEMKLDEMRKPKGKAKGGP